jgi:hypothetical protein
MDERLAKNEREYGSSGFHMLMGGLVVISDEVIWE